MLRALIDGPSQKHLHSNRRFSILPNTPELQVHFCLFPVTTQGITVGVQGVRSTDGNPLALQLFHVIARVSRQGRAEGAPPLLTHREQVWLVDDNGFQAP